MGDLVDWLQQRVSWGLKPKAEDLKALLNHWEYRNSISEFIKNEDIHRLFVFSESSKGPLVAALDPPSTLQSKCVFFMKSQTATPLTVENIAENVMVFDTSKNPLKHMDLLMHQVFMPVLCGESALTGALDVNADKLLDTSHRFLGQLEMIRGHIKGSAVLPIPPFKALSKTTASPVSRSAFIHVLESTVIGWIKQVKVVLKHDTLALTAKQSPEVGLYQEEALWEKHIQQLHYLNTQLDSDTAREILRTLQQADSTYAPAVTVVCRDIDRALSQAEENMQYFGALLRWFELLKSADTLSEMVKYIPPLVHTMLLVWTHSRHYHQPKIFVSLLNLMANEVMNIAIKMIGDDVLKDPSKSFLQLKGALKLCATFRGCYLDVKAKADEINSKKVEESHQKMPRKPTDSLWSAKLYGPLSARFTPQGWQFPGQQKEAGFEEWVDSPWPSHGAPCFQSMNQFMERCNDVLELVQTIRHFQLLETAAEVGGTGTSGLDAMVREIQESYKRAMASFTSRNAHMLSSQKNQPFEKSFFDFRMTMKELEYQIAGVLRSSFQQCPTIGSQLRLLHVFQGVINRELVQEHLKDKEEQLVSMLIEEVHHVMTLLHMRDGNPPMCAHTPPVVNTLLWLKGLRSRISEPMTKLKEVSPQALKGDLGWKLRHLYTEVAQELERSEINTVDSWRRKAEVDLSKALKMPLLRWSSSPEDLDGHLESIEVNLDPDFMRLLREAVYLRKAPFHIKLSDQVVSLVQKVDVTGLRMLTARLEAVVCKYNQIVGTIGDHERRLLDGRLAAAQELLKTGLSVYTWTTEETADFIELATTLVCSELYSTFATVRNNYKEIAHLSNAWSTGCLDMFSGAGAGRTYSVEEFLQEHEILERSLERQIVSDGQRIRRLIQESFTAVGISEASPAWQDYMEYIDVLLLQDLKQMVFSSLASLLNTVLEEKAPALRVRVELLCGEAGFSPPLEERSVERSLLEHARHCAHACLRRAAQLSPLCQHAQGSYLDYLAADNEVTELSGHILEKVQESTVRCQATLEVIRPYEYLWKKDVNETLKGVGRIKCDPGWSDGTGYLMDSMDTLSDRSHSRQSTNLRSQSTRLIEAERSFLAPGHGKQNADAPTLDDYDSQISTYRTDRDNILHLQDLVDVGWIRVDFQPIKQVLAAYAFKWMWTFAKYLMGKMTGTLQNLDAFLKRTEPQLERITGEEKDTGFFMKIMRLFNEVLARQAEMEGQFIVMQKTVKILEKYEFKLPVEEEKLLGSIPGRWNNLKTRVSLAKQRLSPQIQQESGSITKDLESFGDRLHHLKEDIEESDVYTRDCSVETAYHVIKSFGKEVKSLQREAKDLKELQGLLDMIVVDFRTLNECHHTVRNLTLMWQAVEIIRIQQSEWKSQPWQDIDTVQLVSSTDQQRKLIKSLAREVHGWDVYVGTLESINVIQLTLPLIEDLLSPAMRTRHWKQLARLTGGRILVAPERLRGMTLGDLLTLGLQKHADNVKTIVERAVKDVALESGLKNCEEVWLSRIFDLRPHCTMTSDGTGRQAETVTLVTNAEAIFEELEHHQMALESMKDKSEAGSFADEVTKWQRKLQIIEVIVRLLLEVQDKWTDLEQVLTCDAVRGDLPTEAATFAAVHRDLCSVMNAAEENPNVLQICTRGGLQDTLRDMKERLDRCQCALLCYLETRRSAFPRFFFLPLEDTLKIICCACNPAELHRYLYKVFEHMGSLIFERNNEIHEARSQRIVAVKSSAGEQLCLTEPLDCGGPAERWLELLVGRIRSALQRDLHRSLGHTLRPLREIHSAGARRVAVSRPTSHAQQDGERDGGSSGGSRRAAVPRGSEGSAVVSSAKSGRPTWILGAPSQAIHLATQIQFTRSLERHLTDLEKGQQGALQDCLNTLMEAVERAAKMLKDSQTGGLGDKHILPDDLKSPRPHSSDHSAASCDDLASQSSSAAPRRSAEPGDTEKLSNHILLLLYQCDILRRLMDQLKNGNGVDLKAPNALFLYCYDESSMDVIVKVRQHEFSYGFEYHGSAWRSVITPQTERTLFHLCAAVARGTGGLCIGSEGVGKKTLIKELSLCLGRALYFICCSETLDHKTLSDVCKGVASSGCWACFAGIDRMSPPVLNEAAHCLRQICEAMAARNGTVLIQSQHVHLNPSGGYFATSLSCPVELRGEAFLPRYVSPAATIPDSLLRDFRIVSVTQTNTEFMAETLLKMAGFSDAKLQARKLLALLEICPAISMTTATPAVHCGNANGFPWMLSGVRRLISTAGCLLRTLHNDTGNETGKRDWYEGRTRRHKLLGELWSCEDPGGGGVRWHEDRALVMAVHRCLLPCLTGARLTQMSSLMKTLWQSEVPPVTPVSRESQVVCEESLSLSSLEEPGVDLQLNSVKEALSEEKEAIAGAIKRLDLSADEDFASGVHQLTHLVSSYQTIAIVGPAGCGKTLSLQTYLQALREMGSRVHLDTLFTRALESHQLLGCVDTETGCLNGLVPKLLRSHWLQHRFDSEDVADSVKAVHLDGEIDAQQMERMQAILCNNGSFILPHNELFKMPSSLKLFWELESLGSVSPAVICCMGILAIPGRRENWKLLLAKWLQAYPETRRHLLQQLTAEFLEPVVSWMSENSASKPDLTGSHVDMTDGSVQNMVQTFCRLFKAVGPSGSEVSSDDVKKCFIFSCIWAFGGNLRSQYKTQFSLWWRERFRTTCILPNEQQIWDYYIDNETWQFLRWSDNVPPPSAPCGRGITALAFVHTIESEQLLYLTTLLSDAGHPVMLVGEASSGKSAVLSEYLHAHSSGDVADVLRLKVQVNRATSPRVLWESLFHKLEWHHGTLFTPVKKKRLICLLDDLHLAQVDTHGSQPACELLRQLLDCGGGFDPVSLEWRLVRNITFLAAVDVNVPANAPKPSARLLRHFSLLPCSYPSFDDQYRIFSTLMNVHFLQSSPALKTRDTSSTMPAALRDLLSPVTCVTIEIQDRLRTMFLGTPQRSHYLFTLRDLGKIFRNLCLSLTMSSSAEALLYLWRHECDWVFGHRMASNVDYRRYQQEFGAAVKKAFIDEEQVELILSPVQPLLSNVIDLEGGLIAASPTQWQSRCVNQTKPSLGDGNGDGYQHSFDEGLVRKLLEESVREYNKTNPRIAISFYRSTIQLVCRLTRNLLAPHDVAHTMLCGEGCPGIAVPVARLAAHLCGFSVVHVLSPATAGDRSVQSQLADCCIQAGIQEKKVLCLMSEESMDRFTMVYITHLVVPGSITHLFTSEQLSSIINEVRGEVPDEGMNSTGESALEFFVHRVTQNLRCLFVCPTTGSHFSQNCLEFQAFTNRVNMYLLPHWSRPRLVEHALHYVGRLETLGEKDKENISYLLASMHLSVCKHDCDGGGMGCFGHLTNGTFETFTQTFVRLFERRRDELMMQHHDINKTLEKLTGTLKASAELQEASRREQVVVEEHRHGVTQMLLQIGQDKAVAEQQVRAVRRHMSQIRKIRELLPKYQLALDRSVYKCTAMVSDVKKLVAEIDINALGELRATQQPDVDTQDLMASIITLLKSPTADLTWSKGAKRQMANLERFLDELSAFSEIQLAETTLGHLETVLQKPSFAVEMDTGRNSAVGSLLKWLQGAVFYHRVMVSKVRPLQKKVSEMRAALEEAVQRLKSQQARKGVVLRRLEELQTGFEEASIDKNEQERRGTESARQLSYLDSLEEILHFEHRKHTLSSCAVAERTQGLLGSTAMAAGLLCYLGPYEHLFCQLLLSLEWPKCLRDRGLPFLIDSLDPIKGRVIDFSVEFFKGEGEETEKETDVRADCYQEREKQHQQEEFMEGDGQHLQTPEDAEDTGSFAVDLPAPAISSEHYGDFVKVLLKAIVGDEKILDWEAKDWTLRQMQNAAILLSSWQKPAFLIYPSNEAEKWFKELQGALPHTANTCVQLGEWPDSTVSLAIEKALISGCSLFLCNYSRPWDAVIRPLVEHCSAGCSSELQSDGPSSIICLEGRRLLCSDEFKLYMATSPSQSPLAKDIGYGTTLVSYGEGEETMCDFLLHRVFARTQPGLHDQLKRAAHTVLQLKSALKDLERKFQESVCSSPQETDALTDIFNNKKQLSERLERVKSLQSSLSQRRNALLPIAQRGALIYAVLRALSVLAREYKFPLSYFLCLFENAVEKFLKEDGVAQEETDIKVEDAWPDAFSRAKSITDPEVTEAPDPSDRQQRNDPPGEEPSENNFDKPATVPDLLDGAQPQQIVDKTDTLTDCETSLSLSTNQIGQLVDHLTETVHQTINQSLLPEHSLVLSCMLSLCIQLKTEGAIEEEELSFLLKGCRCYPGHPLSLGDFGCDAEPPAWIPPNQWESVLSLSLFPGPLDGVCVQIVEHSSEWEIWFRLDCPERERLPLEEAMVRDNTAPGGSEGQILDIHRLLVLRALRPDRLATALPVYMLEQGNAGTINPRLTDVKCLEEDWVGILVLLPVGLSQDNGPSNEHLVMSVQPAAVIRSAAQGRDISVSVVSVREDCQSFIDEALGDMTECGGWLVIENVHLAPVSLLKKIQDKVNLAKNMAGEQTSRKPFKVWLLAELGTPFPEDFLSELHKVSWHVLLIHHLRRESEASDLLCGEQGGLLPMAVVSALEQVEKQVWVEVRDLPVWSRQICFNACVLHGLIVGSQFLPGSGLSRLYPVTNAQLQQAMDAVISSGAGLYAPSESFIKALIEEISDMYTSAVTDPEDALYIRGLAREVLLQSLQPQGEIAIGEFVMPVPAADTDCALYSSWLCKNLPEFGHCSALALHKSTRKLQHQSSVAGLLRNLSVVYEALQCGLPSSDHEDSPAPPGTAALRLALDLVLEQLPGLLEIGAHFQKPRSASQRPSGLGSDQMENTDSMDAVGHALLQECDWMNTLLCHIGQQVTALSGCTLMDGGVLPAHLAEASSALRRRRVPRSWMHPHCRPATSSLQAWMEDLKTKHGQLKRWVDDTVSSVWLGGLANPAALVLSLRQAFAAAHACLPDEMVLRCDVAQTAPPDLQPHHLILEGLCLQGASWDFSSSMLEESSEEFFPLPYVILRPVLLTAAARAEQTELFECPVYMNSMRQCCLLKLPLRSGKSEQYWRLKKAAVILDIKPPVCFPSQSKGYWAAKRIQNRPPPRGPLRTEAFTSPVGIASRVVSNQPAEQGGVPLPSQAENPKAFAEFQGSASGGGPSDQLPPLEGRPPPTSAGPQNPPWAQDPKIFPHVTAEESPTELPRDWSQKSEEDAGVQPILREAMSEDNKVTEEDVPTQLAERDPGAEDGFQRAEGGYLHLDSSS